MGKQVQAYRVAGHVFTLEMDEGEIWDLLGCYEPFRTEDHEDPVFTLTVDPGAPVPAAYPLYTSEPSPREQRIDILTFSSTGTPGIEAADGYVFEMSPWADAPLAGTMTVGKDFRHGTLVIHVDRFAEFCINNSLMLLYAFRNSTRDTLEMHASVVVYEGKGYMFLGKSGTGKSTHSSLWLKNIPGAFLLNDDNPSVRVSDGEVRVYGTPWSGKTPCYLDMDFPLGGVVRLQQAPRNRMVRLSVPEAFASISSSSSGLRAIRPVADGLFATISSVISTVPCYLLECLPDPSAAVLCCETLCGHEVVPGNNDYHGVVPRIGKKIG